MNRLIKSVSLDYEYTGAFGVVRIVLYDHGSEGSIHDFPCKEPILR